ncbi:hypothetical protein [Gluconobacter kondonii]|uniref:hypothetical protein n=1 Tax=Gluconobacter kondonii TaxID=941463 RepID=UPI001B8B189C|nr:hypothetical protein [Gluconobacter kondonii]MBS1054918.1 hypothetical protein [Gluconobacter kondonii]
MKDFIDELVSNGIREDIIELSSKRGGDDPLHSSKWKIYYRSSNYPEYGVLLAYEDEDYSVDTLLEKLNNELRNYEALRVIGYDVPRTCDNSIRIQDHLKPPREAAAIIVEHISGAGPYKAKTGISSIKKIVSQKHDLKNLYDEAWRKISEAAKKKMPMDLQVIVEENGRIVTIDPEQIGDGGTLDSL